MVCHASSLSSDLRLPHSRQLSRSCSVTAAIMTYKKGCLVGDHFESRDIKKVLASILLFTMVCICRSVSAGRRGGGGGGGGGGPGAGGAGEWLGGGGGFWG